MSQEESELLRLPRGHAAPDPALQPEQLLHAIRDLKYAVHDLDRQVSGLRGDLRTMQSQLDSQFRARDSEMDRFMDDIRDLIYQLFGVLFSRASTTARPVQQEQPQIEQAIERERTADIE